MSLPITKSLNDIYLEIVRDLKVDISNGVATYPNSPADNIFIQPLKGQIYDTYILGDFVNKCGNLEDIKYMSNSITYQNILKFVFNFTLTQVKALISAALDDLANNWNKTRNAATYSRGYERLYFNTGDPITLASEIQVQTLSGISFSTKNSFTNFVPEYDAVEGLYFIDSFIEAQLPGISSNVEVGTIINLVSNIPNCVKVVNLYKTQFGKDIETDNEFIIRLQGSWQSRKNGLLKGTLDLLNEYPGVEDASIIMPGDLNQVRNEKNAVDVYLIGEERIQAKEDIFNGVMAAYAWERINDEVNYNVYPTTPATNFAYYKFLSQPVLSVESVSYGASSTGPWTVLPISAYSLVNDYTSAFAQSIKGHDYLEVDTTGFPSGFYVKVDYTYNRLFRDLQVLANSYENYSIGSDILFRAGSPLVVDVQVSLHLFSGYNLAEVQDNILKNLAAYFNGGTDLNGVLRDAFKLGQYVDKSDIADIIIGTEGVDYIDLDANFIVTIDSDSTWQRYVTAFSDYLRMGTITYNTLTISAVSSITSGSNLTVSE